MADSVLLELVEVSKEYGADPAKVVAIDRVSFRVARGELVAIMGTSGCGKSTVLSLAGGLTSASSGEVTIGGTPLSSMNAGKLAQLRRRTVGFVFQDYNLVPSLTALENVSLPLELDGVRAGDARKSAQSALESVEMESHSARYPDELSGGQRQRVAIARAVVGSRALILADEPTGALDSETGELVLALLRDQVDAGAGGLLVTHDAAHAAWADRVLFLQNGRIVDAPRVTRPLSRHHEPL